MVASALQRLNLKALPLGVASPLVVGACVALGVLAMPAAALESLVVDSGIAAVLSVAEPPLGLTGRLMLGAIGGLGAGTFAWLALVLVFGDKVFVDRDKASDIPVLRRADAHPDAPARPPVLATRDLGTPFLEVRAPVEEEPAGPPPEQDLPKDLNQPLSAFDPGALLEDPLPAPQPLPPLAWNRPQMFEPTERFETFEITPAVRPEPVHAYAPEPEPYPFAAQPAPAPLLPPEPAPMPVQPIPIQQRPEPIPFPAPTRSTVPQPPRFEPITRPETDATIHALLERLERGVTERTITPTGPAPLPRGEPHGLEDTLASLRKMAMRA